MTSKKFYELQTGTLFDQKLNFHDKNFEKKSIFVSSSALYQQEQRPNIFKYFLYFWNGQTNTKLQLILAKYGLRIVQNNHNLITDRVVNINGTSDLVWADKDHVSYNDF